MPEIQALYKNVSPPTKSRDFKKMTKGELLKIQEENGGGFFGLVPPVIADNEEIPILLDNNNIKYIFLKLFST